MSGDNIGFVDEQEGRNALADVRSDNSETNWCLFSYEGPKSNKIALVGKGVGGADQLVESLKDDMVGYGLVRKTDKIDDSVTVKFGFIQFTGENVPRMQKARISVHSGSVRAFIGQYHIDILATDKSEISDAIINEKISETSGSGSRVVDKHTGVKELNKGHGTSGTSGGKVGSLEFQNASELKEAISDLRKGVYEWVLMSYEGGNSNTIILIGKGNGGAEEIISHLKEDMVGYAIIRKIEKIDVTEAVKFAFIRYVGDNVPRMLKARLGTHFGAVTEFFSPYHVSLDVTRTSEISDDIIMNSISSASGTKMNVKETNGSNVQPSTTVVTGQRAPTKATSTNTTKIPSVPKQESASVIKFIDKESILQDIKDVRNGNLNWILVGYEGKKGNTITSLGKGSGESNVNELIDLLSDDIAAYGLVRKTDKIDESLTVKFAFISWLGDSTDRMHKARLGTHKGEILKLFEPYHVDLNFTSKSEISDEVILKKIQENSGSRSKVRA